MAVSFENVEALSADIQNHLRNKYNQDYVSQLESLLPRVLNKLILSVYPMTTIMPEVSDITGLDNYNLTDQTRFDENTGYLLKNFLDRLPTPVCLVAHNGDSYDFPLLKAEMEKVCVQLSSGIFSADSYIGMKAIFKKRNELISAVDSENQFDQIKKSTPKSFSLINLHNHLLSSKPTISHGAEADCLALLRTTSALGKEWLNWLKMNCKLFSDC